MNEENSRNIEIKDDKIRRQFDEKFGQWYFSIVDVISLIGETSNARNYWKVFKNRLNKAQNKLVTECNQVKMLSRDGKSYLTDVADSHTTLGIIKLISPSNLESFEDYFNYITSLPSTSLVSSAGLSTASNNDLENDGAELLIDVRETDTNIIVQSFLAGVNLNNLLISIGYEMLTISGERTQSKDDMERNYFLEELYWGKFSRKIKLPALIEIDKVDATFNHGLLIIKLSKINLNRIKKIKL